MGTLAVVAAGWEISAETITHTPVATGVAVHSLAAWPALLFLLGTALAFWLALAGIYGWWPIRLPPPNLAGRLLYWANVVLACTTRDRRLAPHEVGPPGMGPDMAVDRLLRRTFERRWMRRFPRKQRRFNGRIRRHVDAVANDASRLGVEVLDMRGPAKRVVDSVQQDQLDDAGLRLIASDLRDLADLARTWEVTHGLA